MKSGTTNNERSRSQPGPFLTPVVLAVLASPRDDNPYQELLYGELRKQGVTVSYDDGPTRSRTLNVALSPLMLAWYRAKGCQVLHLHWVFQFSLPWARGAGWARRAMEQWFYLYLRVASALGYALVWTAHDLLPHAPVFYDDARAHRELAKRADVVIALSSSTASGLEQWGASKVHVVPFGPYVMPDTSEEARSRARSALGWPPDEIVVVHVGKLFPYKGADLLLQAASQLPPNLRVVVAGACSDGAYAKALQSLARGAAGRAELKLGRLSEEDLNLLLLAADVAAFPFREVTNSSALLLANCYGLPAIVPDLPALRNLPQEAVLRYVGEMPALRQAIERFSRLSPAQRRRMGCAAQDWARSTDWATVASLTMNAYSEALTYRSSRRERAKAAHPPERFRSISSWR